MFPQPRVRITWREKRMKCKLTAILLSENRRSGNTTGPHFWSRNLFVNWLLCHRLDKINLFLCTGVGNHIINDWLTVASIEWVTNWRVHALCDSLEFFIFLLLLLLWNPGTHSAAGNIFDREQNCSFSFIVKAGFTCHNTLKSMYICKASITDFTSILN